MSALPDKLRIFNAKWSSHSAGPSLDDNRRTEIFLAGCLKAMSGHPCKGCFNQELWSSDHYVAEATPSEAFENIKKYAPNKYITFVGGEPLDQIKPLSELCELLKKDRFHIIVITHYLGENIIMQAKLRKTYQRLLDNIDALIDGEYEEQFRIWDESKAGDGLHDVIGSGNQRIWSFDALHGLAMPVEAAILDGWNMKFDRSFEYIISGGDSN